MDRFRILLEKLRSIYIRPKFGSILCCLKVNEVEFSQGKSFRFAQNREILVLSQNSEISTLSKIQRLSILIKTWKVFSVVKIVEFLTLIKFWKIWCSDHKCINADFT